MISVGQFHAIGLGRGDIVRLERRGALRRLHPRVYVDHTGPLTRQQRLWAALLFAEPAVVCGPTLLDADADGDIHIAIDARAASSSSSTGGSTTTPGRPRTGTPTVIWRTQRTAR